MKKTVGLILALVMMSCAETKKVVKESNALYEILTQQDNGGANIKFFEILSEPNEIKMLQNDIHLKNKIAESDLTKANFLILNMGEKNTGGYAINVDNVVETDKNIIVTVKETVPESGAMVSQSIVYPYCVVKINSKKEIIIK
ncbi:protease complex subunit PrcB family protein [Flavobacterium sp. PL002]|uniref:protease complex subunit PrcB family protein n=1 Tax=Flavobacterium sp. PL002 TaxID=1897058 RepID=UPI001787D91D|nr:protease complex subunit PrcB family protein [Flavobacterium sp. PL002]MBE0393543.1 hypothetical protein [Flavobacterium sp. PL002]